MNLHLHIRPFQEADTPQVTALWTDVFGYTASHNQPPNVIRCKLAEQPELFFVAVLDERVAGTVMGGYDGHRGWVYSLAVHPERRLQGIGTALMQHLERTLRERGCPKINLQVVGANAATVEFYQRLGYAVEDRISLGKVFE